MTEPTTPTPAGLLIVDKPIGMTSMGVCARIRSRLRRGGAPKRIKVGHGGTLDPLATGVLVILVGKATKQSGAIMAGEKRYTAEVDLSAFSETDDAEGERIEVDVPAPPTIDQIRAACDGFVGEIMQVPPAFSAMKVDGRRAYKLARAGKPPELEPRPVVIHAIDIEAYSYPGLVLDIRCGKGTYIRSLARDLGRALGTGGMLSGLRRTAVLPFTIDQARTLEDLPDPLTQDDLLPVHEIRS